jgi:hypothetical protein
LLDVDPQADDNTRELAGIHNDCSGSGHTNTIPDLYIQTFIGETQAEIAGYPYRRTNLEVFRFRRLRRGKQWLLLAKLQSARFTALP